LDVREKTAKGVCGHGVGARNGEMEDIDMVRNRTDQGTASRNTMQKG
jgi:hypothetical protein